MCLFDSDARNIASILQFVDGDGLKAFVHYLLNSLTIYVQYAVCLSKETSFELNKSERKSETSSFLFWPRAETKYKEKQTVKRIP